MSAHLKELVLLDQYLEKNSTEDVTLFLDSCGPSLARHYIVLNHLGLDRVASFREIHTVSGGVFSLIGYWAFTHEALTFDLQYYLKNFDKDYRSILHSQRWAKSRMLRNSIARRPLLDRIPFIGEMLKYCFTKSLLDLPIQEFPIPFMAYLNDSESGEFVRVRVGDTSEKRQLNIESLLDSSIRIPGVYGVSDAKTSLTDGAYHPEYRRLTRSLESSGHRMLISSPWRSGTRGESLFINVFGGGNAKRKMFMDFASLILNLPNSSYSKDLFYAFGRDERK